LRSYKFPASLETLIFHRILSIRYCVHNSPAHLPVLKQINPVHAFQSYLFHIHFNITLPPKPRSSKWFFAIRFRHLTPHAYFFSPIHATTSAPLTILHLNWGREKLVSITSKLLTIFFFPAKSS